MGDKINLSNIVGFMIAVGLLVGFLVVYDYFDESPEENANHKIVVDWCLINLGMSPCCSASMQHCYDEYLTAHNLTASEFPIYILYR